MAWVTHALLKATAEYVEHLRAELKDAREEIKRLTTEMLTMKRQGFHPPEPPPSLIEPSTNGLAPEIREVIRTMIPPRFQKAAETQAKAWLASDISEADVVTRIQRGEEGE